MAAATCSEQPSDPAGALPEAGLRDDTSAVWWLDLESLTEASILEAKSAMLAAGVIDAGADAVKFQIFTADALVTAAAPAARPFST